MLLFFFSSRRRHTRWNCDWSSDVCSSDLADAGDDDLGPVPQQHLQILLQPRVGPVHDQVRTDRRRGLSAFVAMTAQPVFDVAKPGLELFGAAAIHSRE